MRNSLIDQQDPRVADLFRRIEKVIKTLATIEIPNRRTFYGQRYITDRELSERLKVSRRTLQEYRSSGLIPYYLVCGKALYQESEIQQFLEDCRRKSIEERILI